ncbi:MAG TPA: diguanylate cyclase [Noviherbaspirillum sp.]|uniref:sensor domain-containing diguanylate cyclase n=1 Tax=Noviherbaspirillum sp. TaxID=1926288 RepID=UPI002B477E66|nr:diguanylate cyclase [Noviherbaspirillum sp.]HJV85960.1 diguanylate cyclase [Noviherbaspirillum sp.]
MRTKAVRMADRISRSPPWFLLLQWCLLIAVCVAAPVSRADTLVLSDEAESYSLGRHLSFLEDRSGTLTFDEIRNDTGRFAFTPSRTDALNFGFTRSVYWLRADLENLNSEVTHWFLECQYTVIDRIDLYVVKHDGSVTSYRGGDTVPFAERPVKHRNTIFRIPLEKWQPTTIYLRVQSQSSMQIPLVLWSPKGLLANEHEKQFFAGIYYGIVLAMLLYNLLIWMSIRDINYLYYANYICAWILFQLSIDGYAFELLWPDYPGWGNIATPFFVGYGFFAILQFSREFLQLRQNMPKTDRAFRFALWYFALVMLSALFLDYTVAIRAGTFGAFLGAALIFVTGAVSLKNGVRQARFFMVAWSVLLLSIFIYTLRTFGMLPQVFISEYGLPIGSALEVILLSFALAHRMRLLKAENERIQRQATETLEQRVKQRTLELDHALQRLADANEQLKGLSYTDGLTGVKNRICFDKTIASEWQRSIRAKAPLALLLLDIDHFKKVNDNYGHLAGDACLKQVAAAMRQAVQRATDEVFRYGGEEFVILLPQTGMDGAVHIAEKIRRRIEHLPVEFEGQRIAITVSIGVSSLVPTNEASSDILIANADEAMYVAKNSGRNRVQAYSEAGHGVVEYGE